MSASATEIKVQAHRQNPPDIRLRRFLVWTISLFTAGFAFLGYWKYSEIEHFDPVPWQNLAAGHGIAPAQYRIGVYYTVNFFSHLVPLHFRHIFGVSDFLCAGFSLAILFLLLTRTLAFREQERHTQWGIALLGLVLTQFYLGWTFWYQEPETMPSLAILAASSLLCSGQLRWPKPALIAAVLMVAILGSTIRVDAILAFHAGLLVACVSGGAEVLPLGRRWQIVTSISALAIAASIEHFLAHDMFPRAVREVALFQLLNNTHSVNGTFVLFLSLPPWICTVWLARRYWGELNIWARGIVIGSLFHFALFITFGRAEEVRIFVPFMLLLLPLSAPLLWRWFEGGKLPSTA